MVHYSAAIDIEHMHASRSYVGTGDHKRYREVTETHIWHAVSDYLLERLPRILTLEMQGTEPTFPKYPL